MIPLRGAVVAQPIRARVAKFRPISVLLTKSKMAAAMESGAEVFCHVLTLYFNRGSSFCFEMLLVMMSIRFL